MSSLVVEGQSIHAAAVTNVPTITKPAGGPSNGGLVKTPFTSLRKSPSVNVKLVQATVNLSPSGKPSFSTLRPDICRGDRSNSECHIYQARNPAEVGSEYTLVTADELELHPR